MLGAEPSLLEELTLPIDACQLGCPGSQGHVALVVIAERGNTLFQFGQPGALLGCKGLVAQRPLTIEQFRPERIQLLLRFLGVGQLTFGLGQTPMDRLALQECLGRLSQQAFVAPYCRVQVTTDCFKRAELVPQSGALGDVLVAQALLVVGVHRPTAGRTGRQLLDFVQLRAQVEHLLFELGIDCPFCRGLFTRATHDHLQLAMLRLDLGQYRRFLLHPA